MSVCYCTVLDFAHSTVLLHYWIHYIVAATLSLVESVESIVVSFAKINQ